MSRRSVSTMAISPIVLGSFGSGALMNPKTTAIAMMIEAIVSQFATDSGGGRRLVLAVASNGT
ncbi:hypothetical protein Poly51_44480 [Rubripirellula tenax]|uniref:Uncharacterized protein n=1 Tax=Rubripirellula tenax TaxID=2528015 RepID=A0A5C6EID5_9BACT|nr:hypothetical protein Poly51_44480 [Rubripirellula tenax]